MKTQLKKLTGVALAVTLSLSTSNAVHAEGFFSGLFGGSKDSAGFKTLLENVPADTAYLIGNKEPIPEKEMKEQMQRGKDMLSMITGSDSMKKASSESEGVSKFFIALLEEYSDLLSSDKFAESGLSLQASSVIYGYEMMPVMRISVADKEKLMALVKRAEEKSSYKVEFTKCGDFDCFESTDPAGMSVAAVFLEDHLAISGFSTDKKESIKKHLMGEAKPEKSYSEVDWDTFLKENNYPGYGDGFINLKNVFNFAKPLVSEQMKGLDEKTINGCLSVAEDHINNMPEIVFGTKNFEGKEVDYELLFKTSSVVSTALQTVANDTNISHRTEGAVFDLGININFPKVIEALTQYSGFLIKSGEDNECPMINAQEIRESMGGMTLVMNMGLSQFNSIYASISDVQLDDKMQPKKIDAVVSLGSNNPEGLIAMASSMAPPLASLKIPDDGSTIALPAGLIPTPNAPEIFLSRSEKAINIFIGNEKPTLKEHKNDIAEISFTSMDFKGYMEVLTGVMSALPEEAKNSADMPDLEILKKIGESGGNVHSTTSADKRGLAINYRIQY